MSCIDIKGVKRDGTRMRPASPAPSMHWSYMLTDPYEGAVVCWDDDGPYVRISRSFPEDDESGFMHVMDFIRMHDLHYVIDRDECGKCKGHKACVSNGGCDAQDNM